MYKIERETLLSFFLSLISLIYLELGRVREQVCLHVPDFVQMLAAYVSEPMGFPLAPLRAEWALKLWLLPALPVHVSLQRVLPHVRSSASAAPELAGRLLAHVVARLRYLELGERQQPLLLDLPRLNRQIGALLERFALLPRPICNW